MRGWFWEDMWSDVKVKSAEWWWLVWAEALFWCEVNSLISWHRESIRSVLGLVFAVSARYAPAQHNLPLKLRQLNHQNKTCKTKQQKKQSWCACDPVGAFLMQQLWALLQSLWPDRFVNMAKVLAGWNRQQRGTQTAQTARKLRKPR